MASSASLTTTTYPKLARELRRILAAARTEAEQALARALVDAYWHVGARIVAETATPGDRAALIRRLAPDLEIDPGTLQRAVAFHRAYPRLPSGSLSWGHYRLLLPLKDRAERRHYERLAARESLSVRDLTLAIAADSFGTQQPTTGKGRRRKPRVERPSDPGYLYRASLDRIVDADTLILDVDLGFGVSKRQRLRLAHIDTPPVDTELGQAALSFVTETLDASPHLAVKTHQIDIY
ncbi:MAG: DUF1016 N-terminal domain-containing protein, partial [Myxococcales bacterium]|nr:DUF1016 N-terminal domain-containing protein [Myxococcales bacterium]